ncbi:MAG: hypothetical protein FJW38_23380 [Acidobacteria bacterium]|nr:hypothetical protein [Acidobacteriota bacterium]
MVAVEEAYLPISISVPEMTDERFQRFCEEYPDYFLEYTSDGKLHIMPPTDRKTSSRNLEIGTQLKLWARQHGGLATDPSLLSWIILYNGTPCRG